MYQILMILRYIRNFDGQIIGERLHAVHDMLVDLFIAANTCINCVLCIIPSYVDRPLATFKHSCSNPGTAITSTPELRSS